jgi:hypothetical protein
VGVGDTDVLFIKTLPHDFGTEPAVGLKLAQVSEQSPQRVVVRGAGAIHGGLCGNRIASFRFYNYTAMETPGRAHYFYGQHLLDGADGIEVFPKCFRKPGVFLAFFRPDTVLSGERAELEMIGFDLRGGCHDWGLLFGSRVSRRQPDYSAGSP